MSSTEDGTEKGEHLLRELFLSGRLVQRHRGVTGRQTVAPSTPPLSNATRLTSVVRTRGTRRPETSAGTATEERHYSSHRLCTLASSSRTTSASVSSSSQMHHRLPAVAGASGATDGTSFR